MANWDYIIGEGGYTQGFQGFNTHTKAVFDGTGLTTPTISILQSDGTASTPAVANVAMSVDTTNPLRITYDVTTAKMPQTKGSYLAIIKITDGGTLTRKTFEVNLEVHTG